MSEGVWPVCKTTRQLH